MDQNIFRKTLLELNDRPCAFEKALLSGLCRCSRAERFNLAEREGVHCHAEAAQRRCLRLLELLRGKARFALRIGHVHETLPHNKALRLQIGGLRGLGMALDDQGGAVALTIDDIDGLVQAALGQYGELEDLPFAVMIKEIAAYKGRERRGGRKG